jgi:carboxylesterase
MAARRAFKVLRRVLLVLLGILAALALVLFTPILDPDLTSRPKALGSYADAVAAIDEVHAHESELPLLKRAGSIADLTGKRTPVALVIFHGYTNTPDAFRLVAKAYQDQGYNVWVPRMPHHGLADKMTDEFSKLTAEELRSFADDAIDVGAGLGEQVWVMGLSGGGGLATWAAIERPEVTHTVLISPLLNPGGYASWEVPPMARALRLSPVDSYSWWAPEKGADNVAGMVYPRYSLKGIAAYLGMRLWAERKPAGVVHGSILLLRNAGDASIDHDFNEALVRRLAPPDRVQVYQVPADAHLPHDYVCPDPEFGPDTQIVEGYHQLQQALGIPMPDPLATR